MRRHWQRLKGPWEKEKMRGRLAPPEYSRRGDLYAERSEYSELHCRKRFGPHGTTLRRQRAEHGPALTSKVECSDPPEVSVSITGPVSHAKTFYLNLDSKETIRGFPTPRL
ncbi:hypothetical protein FQN53_006407 [Emmonsiellopsis sp. PD_33]|nr:hypothetical protein FQN53_006407 [Emmonsiellopsis sp. PD_33]